MAGAANLEAIQVKLGVDSSDLESELKAAALKINRELPKTRTLNVHVAVTGVDRQGLDKAFKGARDYFQARQKVSAPQDQLRIAPRLVVDPRILRDFRRDIERTMRQGAQANANNAIHVPVKAAVRAPEFIKDIETALAGQHVTIDVQGRWGGWEGGNGPPTGGGPTGGPATGPTGGRGRGPASGPASGPTSGPTAARSAPARPGARGARGAAAGWSVADVDAFWKQQNAELDRVEQVQTRHQERFERRKANQDKHAAEQARRQYLRTHPGATPAGAGPTPAGPGPTPAQGSAPPPPSTPPPTSPQGSAPPTPGPTPTRRQQRQAERRERMAGGAPSTSSGPGNRSTTGASRNPAYVEPEGGRVTVDNVRAGSVPPELKGEERAQYIAQQRARPTPGPAQAPQPGEPTGRAPSRSDFGRPMPVAERNAKIRRGMERRAQEIRQQQAALRAASPEDQAARGLLAKGMHGLDDDEGMYALAAMVDTMGDRDYRGSFEDLLEMNAAGRGAYGVMFHGERMTDKTMRKQLGVIRGTKKGDINTVDPRLLAIVSALDAGRQYSRVQANPLEVVKAGDNKRRGRGGKVGQRGGFTAGQLASESVDQAKVNEIMERRRIGGKGNGWKTLSGEFDKAEINRAKALIKDQQPPKPVEPIEPGKAYGGFMEDAPPIPGGQGMTRGGRKVEGGVGIDAEGNVVRMPGKSQYDIDMEKLNDGTMTRDEFRARHGVGTASGRVSPPVASLHEEVGGRSGAGDTGRSTEPPPTPDFGAAGRPRMRTPPPIEHRAYGRVGAEDKARWGFADDDPEVKAFREKMKQEGYDFSGWGFGNDPRYNPNGPNMPGWGEGFRANQPPGGSPSREKGPTKSDDEHVQKIMNMANPAMNDNENERNVAIAMLRARGIPGFAEGGLMRFGIGGVAGRLLRQELNLQGPLPRVGSLSRQELETRYQKRMGERSARSKKLPYQQGGRSDPKWMAARAQQLKLTRRCAYCGNEADTVDHLISPLDGGDIYSPDNLVSACRSCNSKRGRASKTGGLPFYDRSTALRERAGYDDELGAFRRGKGYAEGGRMMASGLLNSKSVANVAMVGERGPELIVEGKNGQTEVIPHHKVQSWMSGNGYATGGTLRMRDTLGRPQRATEARMTSGILAGGDITRVFVVNWPPTPGYTAANQSPSTPGANAANAAAAQAQAAAAQAQAAAAQAAAAAAAGGGGGGGAAGGGGGGGGGGAGGGAGGGGPVPGAGGAAPLPGAGHFRRGTVDPYDRVRARELSLSGELRTGSLESRIGDVRAGISGSLQEVPVRALTVAFGQIAQQMIGGRSEILARARGSATAASRAQRAVTQYQGLRQKGAETRFRIADIEAGRETFDTQADRDETLSTLRDQYQQNRVGRAQALQVARQRVSLAEAKEKEVLTRPQQFKAQAVGLGGILAGGIVFNAGVQAVSAGMQAIESAAKPLVQALLGWPEAIDKVTSSVRDNITAMRGQVSAGTAAAVAPAGISAGFLDRQGEGVTRAGMYRAAEQAAAQALEITRASRNAGGRGLYEGIGGVAGTNLLTEVTGGQPGVMQDITKRLGKGPNEVQQAAELALRVNPLTAIPANIGAAMRGNFGLGGERGATPEERKAVIDDLNLNLEAAAEYAGRAADAFKLIPDASQEMRDAMVKSAAAVSNEAKTRAEELSALGIAVTGPGGRALQGREFDTYANAQARGQLIQDPNLLLRASQPQREAQMWALNTRANFNRTEDIPQQLALRLANQPLARLGTSYSTQGSQLAETEAGRKTLANLEKYSAMTAKSTTSINALQKRGMEAAERSVARIDNPSFAGGVPTFGVGGRDQPFRLAQRPSPALDAFRAGIGAVTSRTQALQTARDDVTMRQSNLQAKEYANQLRIMERQLTNAQDLWAAINGSASDTIGGLQGQNLLLDRQNTLLSRRAQRLSFKSEDIGFASAELQRQSQQLSFGMAQRQINFSVAQAGFTAPGQTAEERTARIEEAKLQAAYDQKQLDLQIKIAAAAQAQLKIAKEQSAINRQMFANSNQQQDNAFAIATKQAKQDVDDMVAQLELFKEARAIEIDTKAVEEAIDRVRTEVEVLNAETQSYVEQGNAVREQVIDDIARLKAETGRGFGELVDKVSGAWQKAANAYINEFIKPVYAAIRNGGFPEGSGDDSVNRGPQAAGGIHSVSSPTRFIAGEAGNEAVIVLRNPTSGMTALGGGVGGGTVVNIGGVSVILQGGGGTDADAERLATIVTDRISRKLAMIGV